MSEDPDWVDSDADVPEQTLFGLLEWAVKAFIMLPFLLAGVAILVIGDWLYGEIYGE